MNRETALAAGSVALLAVTVLGVVLFPGVGAEPDEPVRPSVTELRSDAPPAITSVDGDTVTLRVDTRLDHRGGPAENVSLEVRAVDAETGLLADRVVRDVGDITGQREERVLTNLTLAREGGYRIETILYEDRERIRSGTRTIDGVGSLQPDYARSTVQIQRFSDGTGNLPAITYAVDSVDSGEATLRVSAALTNVGGEPTDDVEVRIRARQADSNAIADEVTIDVAEIRPGRTVSPGAELTVPDGYNYWLDAMVVSDGVVVDTAVEPANLDPERTLEANRTREDVAFDAGDFERGTERPMDDSPRVEPTSEAQGPGFGVLLTVLAVGVGLLLAGRRNFQ